MEKYRTHSIALLLVLAAPLAASADLLHDYNLVVVNNLSTTSETEGRAIIGGNVSGNATQFGFKLPSNTPASSTTLEVGGNITNSQVTVSVGSLLQGGATYPSGNNLIFGNGGSRTMDSSLTASLPGTLQGELNTDSAYYKALTTNSTVTAPTNQPGPVTFTAVAGANHIAVFNVDGSIFSNQNVQQYNLVNNTGATSFVFNVFGTSISFNQGNFTGGLATTAFSSSAIFNFYQATSLSFTNHFYGAVLAPLATFSNSTAVEGSVFVQSFNQSGEVHLPNYAGPSISSVPEPASIALLGIGALGGLALDARRRRARARAQG